jgi:hypothetical protein
MNYVVGTIIDPFAIMSLTTANHPEDSENEIFMRGQEIGYALTTATYSGTDILRGTYNPAESSTSPELVRIVIDFPTHASNGTFQSIYFRETNPVSYTIAPYTRPFNDSQIIRVEKVGDKWYVLNYYSVGIARTISVYDIDFNLLSTTNFYTGSSNIGYDFTMYNDNAYIVATGGVYRSSINSLGTQTRVYVPVNVVHPVTGVSSVQYPCGIIFDPVSNTFKMLALYGTSSTFFSLIEFNTAFVKISQRDFVFNPVEHPYTNLTYATTKLDIFKGELLIVVVNDTCTLDWDTGVIERTFVGQSCGFVGNEMINISGYINPNFGFSSRSLLPEPFTKTSAQTMKITYDFILPPLLGGLTV